MNIRYIEQEVCVCGCVCVCLVRLCVCAIKITLFASCNFIELEEHTLPKVFTQLANLSRQEGAKGGERESGKEAVAALKISQLYCASFRKQ